MQRRRVARLFHGLMRGVVVSATALGCGGRATAPEGEPPPEGDAPEPPTTALLPSDCQRPEHFWCSNFQLFYACDGPSGTCDPVAERRSCSCDPERPASPGDCSATQQFTCNGYDPEHGCSCNLEAPLAASDCFSSRDFVCRQYDPPSGCQCAARIL